MLGILIRAGDPIKTSDVAFGLATGFDLDAPSVRGSDGNRLARVRVEFPLAVGQVKFAFGRLLASDGSLERVWKNPVLMCWVSDGTPL